MTKGKDLKNELTFKKPEAASSESQPLNFKVTPQFRREFRLIAADQDIKLIDLLYDSFDAYKREKGIK